MAKIAGVDVLVYVNTGTSESPTYTLVGGQSEASLEREAEQIDVTSKDSANDNYAESLPGLKSWTLTCNGFVPTDDAAFDLLEEKFENREPVEIELTYPTGKKYNGEGYIVNLSNEFAVDDGATFEIEIAGNGKLEITTPSP